MATEIIPYAPEHEALVQGFNERAKAHNAPFSLSKTAIASWLPKSTDTDICREYWLVIQDAAVRGGFTLRRQRYWLDGQSELQANYQGPLSEGLWDTRFKMVGLQMLMKALRESPRLNAIGMGGLQQPLPRQLASARWALLPIPFRFRVLDAGAFLRNIRPLRTSKARRILSDTLAFSGMGAVGIHTIQAIRTSHRVSPHAKAEPVEAFGPWADEIWDAAKGGIRFCAVRDAQAQQCLFGDGNKKNIILRCNEGGKELGWAVVRCTPMQNDKYFGDLRVGSLVDCMAVPGAEATVTLLALRHLSDLGAQLVVTNQSHQSWLKALRVCGFLEGPSNYLFAASPSLATALGPLESSLGSIHFNRADGDGPIHL